MPYGLISLIVLNPNISKGLQIAVSGMLIVVVALLLLSLFITSLPHILKIVARVWPEAESAHMHETHPESLRADDDAVIAAIGFVLHTEFQRQLSVGPVKKD